MAGTAKDRRRSHCTVSNYASSSLTHLLQMSQVMCDSTNPRPDPLSNIRPVIYASQSTRPTSRSSPYSTSEFPYSENDASLQDLELEWRLNRERVDMTNHRFWASLHLNPKNKADFRQPPMPILTLNWPTDCLACLRFPTRLLRPRFDVGKTF